MSSESEYLDFFGLTAATDQEQKKTSADVRKMQVEELPHTILYLEPIALGRLVNEHYGVEKPVDPPDLRENWQRALAQLAAQTTVSHSGYVTTSRLDTDYGSRFGRNRTTTARNPGEQVYEECWDISPYLANRPQNEYDPVRFTTDAGTFEAAFKAHFMPINLQANQMRDQLLHQEYPTKPNPLALYDTAQRFYPYPLKPKDLDISGLGLGRVKRETLEEINANYPLLIPGVDYTDQDGMPDNFYIVQPALLDGLKRAEKRLFDPKLSTIASIEIEYTPLGNKRSAAKHFLRVPNPQLPLTTVVPPKFESEVSNLKKYLRPVGSLRRILGVSDELYRTLLQDYVTGLPSQSDSVLLNDIVEWQRPAAEAHLFPALDADLKGRVATTRLLLDTIEK